MPNVPENVPESVPENVPEYVPENVPENMPENVPVNAPENVPENDFILVPCFRGPNLCFAIVSSRLGGKTVVKKQSNAHSQNSGDTFGHAFGHAFGHVRRSSAGHFGNQIQEHWWAHFRGVCCATQATQAKSRLKKHGQPIQQKPKRMKFDHLGIAKTSATQEDMVLANAHFVTCSSSSSV